MGLNLCQRETQLVSLSTCVKGRPNLCRSLYQQSAAQHAAMYVATAGATNPTIHTTRIQTQDGQNINYYITPPRTNKKPAFSH